MAVRRQRVEQGEQITDIGGIEQRLIFGRGVRHAGGLQRLRQHAQRLTFAGQHINVAGLQIAGLQNPLDRLRDDARLLGAAVQFRLQPGFEQAGPPDAGIGRAACVLDKRNVQIKHAIQRLRHRRFRRVRPKALVLLRRAGLVEHAVDR